METNRKRIQRKYSNKIPWGALPTGKPTPEQVAASGIRSTLSTFAEMFELANRAKKVGVVPVAVLGCNPTLEHITPEQIAAVRAAVEKAEQRKCPVCDAVGFHEAYCDLKPDNYPADMSEGS